MFRFKNFLAAKESFNLEKHGKDAEQIVREVEEFFNQHGVEVQSSESVDVMLLPKGLKLEIDVKYDFVDFLLFNDDEIVCDWTIDLEKVLQKFRSFEPI